MVKAGQIVDKYRPWWVDEYPMGGGYPVDAGMGMFLIPCD